MRELDVRLDEIDGQIAAVAWSVVEPAARIGKAIGSSAELNEVLLRTLAAAGAVRAAEGSSISVRRPDGTVATAFSNVDPKRPVLTAVESSTGLTVPLGADHSGSLTVYSRHPHGFDAECRGAADGDRRSSCSGGPKGTVSRRPPEPDRTTGDSERR